jgi:two-component system response regulator AtoC
LRSILVVDDDPAILTSVAEALADEHFDVHTAAHAEQALGMIERLQPAAILSDVRMPGMDGIAFVELLKERHCSADVVLMTAFDDMPTVVASMRAGAVDFLVKPLDLDHLMQVMTRVLADRTLRVQSDHALGAATSADVLVGRDPRMIEIYKRVGQAARSTANILIRGESGTGKELIARAVHRHSAAAKEPFVPVNCASLPSSLLESELFGHVRGAFTGAINARRGVFAVAARGTVFLDEIGDTTLEFQSKLLRVLQNREYQPVGSEARERTEARVIAATHRDLEAMVEQGKFREDLYYRLRVVEITIPPLRERNADIPLLAQHLVRRACASMHVPEATLSNAAIDVLLAHRWPGNVRELENCLARAVVLAAGNVIRPEHLALTPPRDSSPVRLRSMAEVERDHIEQILMASDGNRSRAAAILKISRPRLTRLLRKYGLE